VANNKLTHITSRGNPLLVRLRRLARHAGDYRKQGQVLLEGEHLCQADSVITACNASAPPRSAQAWHEGRYLALAEAASATVIVSDAAMADLSTLETPVQVAFVVPLPERPKVQADAPSVVLDRIQDAGNVGSILRSAAAFGFGQVIALRETASLWSPKVLRAAMGAHFGLDLVEGVPESALEALSLPLLGTSSHAAHTLAASGLPSPCAWVFGNEGEGMSAGLAARCTLQVRIPQPGGEESLNVAAAAAVCLYESVRRSAAGRTA
jgi:TrmH family RNA methyltransferase